MGSAIDRLPGDYDSPRRTPKRRNDRLNLTPWDCTECPCERWQWNGRPSALHTDLPSGCVCGCLTSRHRFRATDGKGNLLPAAAGPDEVA